jgi:ankyrin repeat protein
MPRDADGWTPLMCCALHGHTQLAQQLLRAGTAEVEARNGEGHTALMIAAIANQVGGPMQPSCTGY